jgi:hypothetical protein
MKFKIGEKPKEIWPWFELEMRIGEGGFIMPSDEELIFVAYPGIYKLKKGKQPKPYFDFSEPIKRIRPISNNQILLLGDGKAWLSDMEGEVIQIWDNLLRSDVQNAPLNRNQIFDLDYNDGELLLAYWGNRSFEVIKRGGKREKIIQLSEPLTPHWLTYIGNQKMLFASEMKMDGSNPKPHLLLQKKNDEIVEIWTENTQ